MTPILAAVLAVESMRWNYQGAKEQYVHDLFGISLTRYYQARLDVLEQPEALILDPVLVNRLRRRRVA